MPRPDETQFENTSKVSMTVIEVNADRLRIRFADAERKRETVFVRYKPAKKDNEVKK